ncbi:hypothetical protein DWX41_22425 [Hungatella hathewayi]|uniref:Uncharacterized protein n=1 Tax=Hungatella hathewayi TaxID=154046 RepID=A0A3E2WD78_9FIRM|nr:hypothetical protein DWX41_22425 [Hungatella hathewayi]
MLLPPVAQNHQDFGPNAASPSRFPVFFSYGFLASGQDTEMACTAPQGDPAHLLLSVPSTR